MLSIPSLTLKSGCLVLLTLGLSRAVLAQRPVASDSLLAPHLPLAARPPGPRFVPSLIIDNRNSFVKSSAVRIIGLNVGLIPRGKHYRLGLAGYTLRRSYSQLYTYSGKGKSAKLKDTFTPELNLTYFTPNFTYIFFHRRFIELSIPVDVGLGRSHYTVTDGKGNTTTASRGFFFPAEVGFGVLLRPTRWGGVSGALGYRLSLKEIDYKEDFNGWYYSYRVNLFIGPIWRDLSGAHRHWVAWRLAHPTPAPPPNPPADGIGNP